MFTPQYRAELRAELLDYASNDKRVAGGAITGSASVNLEDEWSDIDLAFGVADPEQVEAVLGDFTRFLYAQHAAIHHHDVRFGAWIYRVFFLPDTLQVDLAFVERGEFRPLGNPFKLIFGKANAMQAVPPPVPKEIVGLAWLHALHARSCIVRGKFWQAEYMIGALRDYVLALACVRCGLPAVHGRGFDLLPISVTGLLADGLVRELEADELWRALGVATRAFVKEIHLLDGDFAVRVAGEVEEICVRPG